MQLPGKLLHSVFSEIDVYEDNSKLKISYITMVGLSGEMSEGWSTGIALDASVSMSNAYGRGISGDIPESVEAEYVKKGWIVYHHQDGCKVQQWMNEAFDDAMKQGYIKVTDNIVESETRKFSSYLAENLDESGGTEVIYWACGANGKEIEEAGLCDAVSCLEMQCSGPQEHEFGQGTYLMPAIQYYEEKHRQARRGLFIFITDGKLDDLRELKEFTKTLAEKIEKGERNLFKAILIGIGDQVIEEQMIELDDLDTGTDVDIWDHKMAEDLEDMMAIFAELVDENMIVAANGTVLDDQGNVVKTFNDGVPAKGSFELPLISKHFIFKVGDQAIKQVITI